MSVMSLPSRLRRLDACVVSDALDSLGARGATDGIAPMWNCPRVAGVVQTVLLREVSESPLPADVPHLGARAIQAASPGDVIVVANAGRVGSGAWGGLLSAAAKIRGVGGVVIDGACRDVDDAVSAAFPVFARAATPVSARGRTFEEATGVPVGIGDVRVAPGDLVIADRSGVVFIGQEVADEVIERAEDLATRERSMLSRLRQGAPVTEILGDRYESMLSTPAVDHADANGSTEEGG